MPGGDARGRPGVDSAGAARRLRRAAAEARAVPRAQRGVLPGGLRAEPGRARPVRRRPRACARPPAAAAGRPALPSPLEPALPADSGLPRAPRRRAGDRAAPNRGAARVRPPARPAVADAPGAGRRRPEPDRGGRSRRLGRRDDEPRGRGSRRPGLHDVRRQARRRRRGAHPAGTPQAAHRSARSGPAQAGRRRGRSRAPRPSEDAGAASLGAEGGDVMTQEQKAAAFEALHRDEPFVIPNPWDVGSARVLQALGFQALATTSSGFAFTLGRLDGHTTLDEVVEHVAALDRATDLPVSVDLENGYGAEPSAAALAIERAAEAGAV